VLPAWGLLAAELALLVYVASRTPGPGPVRAYLLGPMVLMAAALGLGAVGILWSLRHPPFARPGRVPALLCLCFVFVSSGYNYPFPAAREERPSKVPFALPVEGEWTVAWGGDDTELNRLARSTPAARYALCLVRTDEQGRTALEGERDASAAAARPEDHLAFGAPVGAPAAGRVVRAGDGRPVGPEDTGAGSSEPDGFGNHVALEVAPGEVLVVGGLQRGSVAVDAGQAVEAGQPLGRVGSSARSLFLRQPHLLLQLQDSLHPRYAQGVPWFLHEVEVDGTPRERAWPEGGGPRDGRFAGQRVRAVPAAR
jgi:hypothetical protein